MLRKGVEGLTDAELLGIVLGKGATTRLGTVSAVELGRILLRTYDSLGGIARRSTRELTRAVGIGPAKAAQLAAAFEIGRRIESEAAATRVRLSSPADVAAAYGPLMRDLSREVFRVVFLNTANVVIGDAVVSEGGLAASIVEPRAVFQRAILENAAALICLHNHPSGNPEPSREDIRITRQLVEAGRLLGVPVHDHLIIAGRSYTSMAERGLL